MAHNDPFTIDLFGGSSLSSGLDLGLTAFSCVEARAGVANDDDPPPSPPAAAPAMPVGAAQRSEPAPLKRRGTNFHLAGDRGLARGWKDRARANVAAIRLAGEIERQQRSATRAEQEQLIRFTGFGASDLANGMFRRPGEGGFRKGWKELGAELQGAVSTSDYASLARCTQYAHFTPEFIVRAMWSGLQRLGWRGGRVLEPGIGTGLFAALMPESLRDISFVTGVELDPVTARIARLLQPRARIIEGDFASTELSASFDLAIGNPPFSDRTVRSDAAYRRQGFRLHDFFIVKAIDRLKPGALAAFVTSSGTMDKADASAREHIAEKADLVGAIRLPERSFRAEAGTDVVVDILFFRKRKTGDAVGDRSWLVFARWKRCRVAPDYHVEVDGHWYSTPFRLIRELVDVRIAERTVEIFHKGQRIASHALAPNRRGHTTIADHMPSAHRRHGQWTPQGLITAGEKVGPATAAFFQAVIEDRPHPEQGFRTCLGILSLVKSYDKTRVDAACQRGIAIKARSVASRATNSNDSG